MAEVTERQIVSGDRELVKALLLLPQEAAGRLQGAIIKNLQEHRGAILKRSTFRALTKAQLRGITRIEPRPRGKDDPRRHKVKSLDDVKGEIFSLWQGHDETDVNKGAAARVEKSIGPKVNRPTKRRYLLIPVDDFISPRGRIRREVTAQRKKGDKIVTAGTRQFDISQLENTFVVPGRGGTLRVMQQLEAGERGKFERHEGVGLTKTGRKRTIRKSKLGRRARVIAILKREAEQARPLDFFMSWESLEGSRRDRYRRLLEDLVG